MWSRQNKGDFAPKMHGLVRNSHMLGWLCEIRTSMVGCAKFAHAWCSCLSKAISSSFQLQMVHGLKRWILDFLRFEMVYSM